MARFRGRRTVLAYVQLARPFTLLAPSLGMLSGGLVAWYAAGPKLVHGDALFAVLVLGTLAAALLNAASNAVNQIFDLDIDRINKPDRPLCTGKVSRTGAWVFAGISATGALLMAALVSTLTRHWGTVALFAAAALMSLAYSAPPMRMKARGWWANITVAIPRGTLLKVAGWSMCQSVVSVEAWYIGLIFGLFLLGATSTKDFADVRGDAAYGVRTLPVAYGAERAARMVVPFLTLPFLLIPIGGWLGILTPPDGKSLHLALLGGIALLWGTHVSLRILADANELAGRENHPAWSHMYYLMLFLQIGFVLAYLPRDWAHNLLN